MNDKKQKRENLKWILIGVILLAIISLIGFGFAEQNQFLEDELSQLEQEISGAGYSWLTEHNLTYSSVEVYGEGGDELLALFEEVSSEGWYKIFLSEFGENESLDVFDLLIKDGGVEFDYIVDPTYYRDIPWGYNLLNDSLNLETFAGVSATSTSVGNNAGKIRIPYEIIQKKMRIDEIRKELKNG